MPDPEELARIEIDTLLALCNWVVQDKRSVNLAASRGVAVRELSFKTGEPDYTLFVDGKAIGTIEAKPAGHSLTGVEEQSEKYVRGVPFGMPAWRSPLPFSYESTGTETRFVNRLDPVPRSRNVFAFHRPEALLNWAENEVRPQAVDTIAEHANRKGNFLSRIQHMPPLIDELWPPKPQAIMNIEQSLRDNRPRSLVQMATGSGKTLLAIVLSYRLIKFAGAKRVLFLVDRGNLGKQTLKEFQQYVSPYNSYKFHEEYVLQRLTSNTLDTTARVCIGTIQRLYSMLKGQDLDEEADERSVQGLESLFKEAPPVEYNPAIPIDTFDIIITDECHRSIYNLWRQVLEYFDAHLIGLTATPSKQTFGFFNQNLVMEYNHERAVADGVNVNYDVYRIQTEITAQGAKIDAGFYVDKRDRQTRKKRWEQLDDDFQYDANQLDHDVVAEDQIRTVLRTFRDKLFTEIFPGRDQVPKTLIFAKDDSHADDIVRICREVFDKGNDFCQKITYRTGFVRDVEKKIGPDGIEVEEVVWKKVSNLSPDQILQAFRNSYNPRIAVTVDMIATGTDVKPLEIVFFMRSVRSRGYFEQMKGRGVRVVSETEMEQVNPGIKRKTRFGSLTEMILGLLDERDYRREANESIEETDVPVPVPDSELFDKTSKLEVQFSRVLWEGNFSKAVEFAREAIDGLNDDALGGYRAWWHFLGSVAANQLNEIDGEIDHLTRARAIGVYTGFLDELLRKRSGRERQAAPGDVLDGQMENIWRIIDEWGWSGPKFPTTLKTMTDALKDGSAPTQFHIGLELLGQCVGAETLRSTEPGAPDGIWIFSHQCFTFEVKSDKDPQGKLYKKELQQAKGHPDWLRNERNSLADTPIHPMVVSPTKALDSAGEAHAKGLYYVSPKQVSELAQNVSSELSKIRTEFAGKEFTTVVSKLKKRIMQSPLHLVFIQSRFKTPLRAKSN